MSIVQWDLRHKPQHLNGKEHNMKIFKHICAYKTIIYMFNDQYYTTIEKYHKCNWSFGH
jgi:hypothetical protein